MSKLKALDKNSNLAEKRVLLRLDLNVPVQDGKVTDKFRIKKTIPTINELIKKKAKIILISHLGRPKGKLTRSLSLEPIAPVLKNLLKSKVYFSKESHGKRVIEKSKNIEPGEVLLLENLRFNKEEEMNDKFFAKELSKMGDIYINEAFSCSHRAHASVCEITNHIDSFAGKLLTNEVNALKTLTTNPKTPVTCIIGGSKISTKIGILKNIIKKIKNIIIVGAMANNFLKHKGYNIGKSIFEENQEKQIENILKECEINNCDLILPEDVIVSKSHNDRGQLKNLNQISDSDMILDIGNKTIKNIYKIIDESKTILWNGPVGYFELKEFSNGSEKIAKKITQNTQNKSLISIAGGGDTVAAINKFKCSNGFTYISTAGGAFLEFLEGKNLPGIKALEINE